MNRVRKITLPDGSNPYFLDGRVTTTALPQFITQNVGRPILQNGATWQDSVPRQFSVTFVGQIVERSTRDLRKFLDDLDAALGLRNRRFYLYEDRYWFVRSEGMRVMQPHPGVRDRHASLELYLRALDPFLRDEAGGLHRCW